MLAGCSSESTIDDVEDITEGKDPMRFNIAREGEAMLKDITRAATPLTTGFMVSCYKAYNETKQQVVMPQYQVNYHVTGDAWNGRIYSYWTYDDVKGQYLRYWDESAFPYRFHAIAPYPTNTSGFVLNDKELTIPTPYYHQTCVNGYVAPTDAEPHLVAQLQRNTDGTDHDIIADKDVNTTSTTLNRDVELPFHHLNSKIRFGVYTLAPWASANKLYIKDLTIKVRSTNFATQASGYHASTTETWRLEGPHAGFTGVQEMAIYSDPIFRFDGGEEVEGNDLRECQTKATAYFMQCPQGIMQIPQRNVELTVSLDLYHDGIYQHFEDVPLRIELEDQPGTYQYSFDWLSGYIHTYYLVIGEIADKLEITFTATLTPWEDISGSLSTDLEK